LFGEKKSFIGDLAKIIMLLQNWQVDHIASGHWF